MHKSNILGTSEIYSRHAVLFQYLKINVVPAYWKTKEKSYDCLRWQRKKHLTKPNTLPSQKGSANLEWRDTSSTWQGTSTKKSMANTLVNGEKMDTFLETPSELRLILPTEEK